MEHGSDATAWIRQLGKYGRIIEPQWERGAAVKESALEDSQPDPGQRSAGVVDINLEVHD
jgi:hypothetical protein